VFAFCLYVATDLAAIPDFVSGAMEHWGLVTFREVTLLYEEGVSSTSNKQRVATVIGHELAHMWFGNLGKLQCTCLMSFIFKAYNVLKYRYNR
jgi:aminopeptidase N